MEANFFQILLWAVFLCIGYYGWGGLLLNALNRAEFLDLGWAARTALGMCASILLGSTLMVFRFANTAGLLTLALVGFCFGVYYAFENASKVLLSEKKPIKRKKGENENPDSNWLYLLIPGALTALAFATSIFWPLQYDPNDDWIGYLSFPEILLQTGTLIEPFSQRRINGLCGQSILLAQIMIVAPPESAHLLDRGFGVLILFGIMIEATRGTLSHWQWLRALVILSAVTSSVPRINTASSQLGIAFLIAFILIVNRLHNKSNWTWFQSLVPALLLAGLSSLRPTFAMAGGGILIIYFLLRAFNLIQNIKPHIFFPLIQTGILTFTLLLPLMVSSYESSRTPMFPFFRGNAVEEYLFFESGNGALADAWIAIRFMFSPEMVVMSIGFLLALFFPGDLRRLSLSIVFIALTLVFLLVYKIAGTASSWMLDIYRFSFPFYAFAFYWVLAKCVENKPGGKWFRHPALAGVALVVFWSTQLVPAAKEAQVQWQVLGKLGEGFKFQVAQLEPFYKELQEQAPRGEKIFAVVDAPYLLDYKRNTIHNVDMIGFATVPPGMPFGKGSVALKEYLTGLGYKYALCVDFNNAVFLYSRQAMSNHQRPEYKEWAKNVSVDFMDNMDEIAKNATIAQAGNARLIKLQ
jgi:hypothetical protein